MSTKTVVTGKAFSVFMAIGPWTTSTDATCTFKAFDGLVVDVRVWTHEGKSYARFQAAFFPEEIFQFSEGNEFKPLKSPEDVAA